jgi:ribosomal protein L14E/L6E/L27E
MLVPGQLVQSAAGRDCGKWMIVMKVLDENYMLLCDGKLRKINNLKKKKIKHIKKTNIVFNELQDKIMQGYITDIEIRKKIADYCNTKKGRKADK